LMAHCPHTYDAPTSVVGIVDAENMLFRARSATAKMMVSVPWREQICLSCSL
jgi:hypothetical protein